MNITPEHKEEIQRQILQVIVTSLRQDLLSTDVVPDIADFVLTGMESVDTEEELVSFLTELSEIWEVFVKIKDIELGTIQRTKEHDVTQEALKLARQGKVEEALQLTKSVSMSK